jgi:hypothetical protein
MDKKYFLYLSGLINEQALYEDKAETKHYMFFNNVRNIKQMAEEILAMDEAKVDAMLSDGHDWASDHISTSRDDMEEVHNWLTGRRK